MNAPLDLHAKLDAAIAKSHEIATQRMLPVAARRSLPQVPAVYVFYDDGRPVHVGRCRKLKDRINGQCSGTVESSSFAFKRTRFNVARSKGDETYLSATYTTKGSRKELFARPYFREEFDRVIGWLRSLHLRYLQTEDDVEQYLLELVVANHLSISMDEFRTT